MLGKRLSVILKQFITLCGPVMKPAVKVPGADLRRGVVIKNEDSNAFCIRLLLTFLHSKVPLLSPCRFKTRIVSPPLSDSLYNNCKYETDALMKRHQGWCCQWRQHRCFHPCTLESALSTPCAFDLTSCFKQLASPQPPLSTSGMEYLT